MFGSSLLGMAFRSRLPAHHLSGESRDAVKLGMGLVATMAALVLGLLTGSAKSSFDTQDAEVKQSAAEIVLLDHVLARYGPETKDARQALAAAIAHRIAVTWPDTGPIPPRLDSPEVSVESIENQVRSAGAADRGTAFIAARRPGPHLQRPAGRRALAARPLAPTPRPGRAPS